MREKRDENFYWVMVVCGNCKAVDEVKIRLGVQVSSALYEVTCGGCECVYGKSGVTVWASRAASAWKIGG